MPNLHDLALIIDSPPGAYTGVGSRQTPADVCELMQDIAGWLAARDWTLRSGSADGANLAFELGCRRSEGKAEIYLPWFRFNEAKRNSLELPGFGYFKNTRIICDPSTAAHVIASEHHPAWNALTSSVRRLHARNAHEVLGRALNSQSTFVLCWTPDGATTTTSGKTGGAGQAIRIANAYNVPVWNLCREDHRRTWEEVIA